MAVCTVVDLCSTLCTGPGLEPRRHTEVCTQRAKRNLWRLGLWLIAGAVLLSALSLATHTRVLGEISSLRRGHAAHLADLAGLRASFAREAACEGRGYAEAECEARGCCEYVDEQCWAGIGTCSGGVGERDARLAALEAKVATLEQELSATKRQAAALDELFEGAPAEARALIAVALDNWRHAAGGTGPTSAAAVPAAVPTVPNRKLEAAVGDRPGAGAGQWAGRVREDAGAAGP